MCVWGGGGGSRRGGVEGGGGGGELSTVCWQSLVTTLYQLLALPDRYLH